MSEPSDRTRDALADGRLELDLLAVALPRTAGWRYTISLCGHIGFMKDDGGHTAVCSVLG